MNVHNVDWRRRTQALSLALLSVLIATPLAFGAHVLLPHANLSLVFLIAVLVTAGRAGMEAAIHTSLLSFLSYNFFFTKPFYSLAVHDDGEVATLLFFMLVAILTGKLAARMQGEMARNRDMVQRLTNINHFTRLMASAADSDGVLHALAHHLARTFHCTAQVTLQKGEESTVITLNRHGKPTAQPVGERGGGNGDGHHFALSTAHDNHGTVELFTPALQQDDQELARMLCDLAGLTLERALLVADLEQARIHTEAERLRTALLSSVSHDLRTPLASIIGSTSSLIEYPDTIDAAGRMELLQTVLDEAKRLNRYIQNLLDMTRLGGGTLTPSRSWVDVNDIIGKVVERLAQELDGLQVVIKVADEMPLLYVQGVLIEQALVNVLDNAARFSPPGAAITIAVTHDSDLVTLTICDQGPGISDAERERVFEMFYTSQQGDRNRQGTGLGLAICRGMFVAHGGSVEAHTNPQGRGSCIRMTLPVVEVEESHE